MLFRDVELFMDVALDLFEQCVAAQIVAGVNDANVEAYLVMFDVEVWVENNGAELAGQFVVEQGKFEVVEVFPFVDDAAGFEHSAEGKDLAGFGKRVEVVVDRFDSRHLFGGEPVLRLVGTFGKLRFEVVEHAAAGVVRFGR